MLKICVVCGNTNNVLPMPNTCINGHFNTFISLAELNIGEIKLKLEIKNIDHKLLRERLLTYH